ncbi:MAG: urease accessory protein UreD, partial [Actinomycetota bacterium]|nr:urease accessory protein UreD [Actinomycetota bacterium]
MTVLVAPDRDDRTERAEPGLLELDLVRATDGRTRVAGWAQRFPQRVTTPMYVDDSAPGTAYLCVQNPTGGLFPGDHLRTRVRLEPGAGLQFGGQSATIVYGGGPARQSYDVVVGDGAVLEHVPGTTIPHPEAELYQRSRVRLDGDAVYLGWERLASGRIARGERHAYRLLDCR